MTDLRLDILKILSDNNAIERYVEPALAEYINTRYVSKEAIKAGAQKAAEEIETDICDRRGLRQEYEQIDDDVRLEILGTWVKIILKNMGINYE